MIKSIFFFYKNTHAILLTWIDPLQVVFISMGLPCPRIWKKKEAINKIIEWTLLRKHILMAILLS